MEYIFNAGGMTDNEVLLTKGDAAELSGIQEVVREFPDCTITDSFRIREKLKEDTDANGSCYIWYSIDRHNRIIDRTPPVTAKLDYLSMMAGIDFPDEEAETGEEVETEAEAETEMSEEGESDDGQSEV